MDRRRVLALGGLGEEPHALLQPVAHLLRLALHVPHLHLPSLQCCPLRHRCVAFCRKLVALSAMRGLRLAKLLLQLFAFFLSLLQALPQLSLRPSPTPVSASTQKAGREG